MYLLIPSKDLFGKSYKIKVSAARDMRKVKNSTTIYHNKQLGPVAFKPYRKRGIVCLVQIPGYDSEKARLVRGSAKNHE